MRVAVVTTSFPVQEGSSSGVFVARLVEHLALRDEIARLEVVVPGGERPPVDVGVGYRLTEARYAPRRLQVLAHRPGGLPVALAARGWPVALVPALLAGLTVCSLRAASRADLLHANWTASAVAAIVGSLGRRPVVTTLRGDDVARAERSRLDRLALQRVVRWSAAVVTVSRSLRDRMVDRYPDQASKIVFIPNGVAEIFYRAGERRVDPTPGGPRLIAVGSLIRRKNFEAAIEAIARCRDPRTSLELIGSGPCETRLRERAGRLGVGDRVRFLGTKRPEEVAERLAAATALVLPSLAEGRPNVVLEAMAAGLPVVASDLPGVRELVESDRTGWLVPPGDATALAARMDELAQDPVRGRMAGDRGRRLLLARGLRWPDTARRYAELYREALGRRATASRLEG